MIDLNYKPKRKPEKQWEPEEIAVGILAIGITIANFIAFLAAL